MKQPTSKEDKKKNVELRKKEHHRLISQSVTYCDPMETQILKKVQQNCERWQVTKADGLKGHLQGTNGKERFYKIFRVLILTSACFRSWRLWKLSLFNIRRALSSKFVPTFRLELRNKSTGLYSVRLSRIGEYNKSQLTAKGVTTTRPKLVEKYHCSFRTNDAITTFSYTDTDSKWKWKL